jgi:hypothetical protein
MSFYYFEGTADYVLATPVIMIGYIASGAITAGMMVCTTPDSRVYMPPSGTTTGSVIPAGLCVNTCASGDPAAVIVHGPVKNLTSTVSAVPPDTIIVITGSGYVCGYYPGTPALTLSKLLVSAGKVISGSTGTPSGWTSGYPVTGLLNCTY